MKKTAYQKFLERIRDKIQSKACEAILNQNDPSRFDQLNATHSNPKIKKRLDVLTCLYGLEQKPEKEPFDTWLAMLWSGQARVPAPIWAVEHFEDIQDTFLYPGGEWELKNWTLDKALGFKAWGKGTPDVLKRAIHVRHEELFREVWGLTLLGFAVAPACKMVAQRYQQDTAEKDRKLSYGKWKLGKGEKSGLQEYLRKRYTAWLTSNDEVLKKEERHCLVDFATSKESFLQRYPESSLPKASIVNKARACFEKKHSEL